MDVVPAAHGREDLGVEAVEADGDPPQAGLRQVLGDRGQQAPLVVMAMSSMPVEGGDALHQVRQVGPHQGLTAGEADLADAQTRKRRDSRSISSKQRISGARKELVNSSPYSSAGMQYGQRKLQRSVTEIRRSRSGRPSVASRFEKVQSGTVFARGRARAGPPNPVTHLYLGVTVGRRGNSASPLGFLRLPGAQGCDDRPRRPAGSGRTLARHAALRIHPSRPARTCPHGGRHSQRGDPPPGRGPLPGPDEARDGVA